MADLARGGEGAIPHAVEIMRDAGRDVCGGLEIGVDLDKRIEGGARYVDGRPMAVKMWSTIMDTVQAIGALPKKRGVACADDRGQRGQPGHQPTAAHRFFSQSGYAAHRYPVRPDPEWTPASFRNQAVACSVEIRWIARQPDDGEDNMKKQKFQVSVVTN